MDINSLVQSTAEEFTQEKKNNGKNIDQVPKSSSVTLWHYEPKYCPMRCVFKYSIQDLFNKDFYVCKHTENTAVEQDCQEDPYVIKRPIPHKMPDFPQNSYENADFRCESTQQLNTSTKFNSHGHSNPVLCPIDWYPFYRQSQEPFLWDSDENSWIQQSYIAMPQRHGSKDFKPEKPVTRRRFSLPSMDKDHHYQTERVENEIRELDALAERLKCIFPTEGMNAHPLNVSVANSTMVKIECKVSSVSGENSSGFQHLQQKRTSFSGEPLTNMYQNTVFNNMNYVPEEYRLFCPWQSPVLYQGNRYFSPPQQMHSTAVPNFNLLPDSRRPLNIGLTQNLPLDSTRHTSNASELTFKPFCPFCKNSGKPNDIVTSHVMKDFRGRNLCPFLRKIVCPLCHSKDEDTAHTMKYCPLYRAQMLNEATRRNKT